MNTSCVACRSSGAGMVAIYQHPNGLDHMFNSVTGIEVEEADFLCIPCYDDLKSAHVFKQKCIKNNILRVSKPSTSSKNTSKNFEQEDKIGESNSADATEDAPKVSTTSTGDLAELNEVSRLFSEEEVEEHEEEEEEELEEIEIIHEDEVTIEESQIMEDHTAQENDEIEDSCNEFDETDLDLDTEGVADRIKIEPTTIYEEEVKISSRNSQPRKPRRQTDSTDENELLTPGMLATLPAVHSLMCEFCFREFSDSKKKIEHENGHALETKPYKCFNCPGEFKDKPGLRSHIRIHSQFKRFKCQYCERRFHSRGNLNTHEKTHAGIKPHLCPHCGKGFTEAGNLKTHIGYHTGEKSYSCSRCSKTFRTHYSRAVHERTHRNDRPHRCDQCEKAFYTAAKLIIHQRVHTGERPYRCSVCPAKFADSSGLARHSKRHATVAS
ncbi:zinc finger protein 1 homolog [Uranotaenia lowii]|uniref:zinc finger protein 1 homolog n=1 Tax=Uranotaenia lowii TaxID=190385 RepID=UPI0024785A8E|nr:zinc finger protein 1 homolog [Uranotaenia lowii]